MYSYDDEISTISEVSEIIYVDEVDHTNEDDVKMPFCPRHVQLRYDKKITDLYDIGAELGQGRFGVVYRCRETLTDKKFAAKYVACKHRLVRKAVEHELSILQRVQHPRIAQLYDAFSNSPEEVVLVMELVEGGELFDRIVDDQYVLTERAVIVFLRQICDAVDFIHGCDIVHMDMKPENILCVTKQGNRIKIIDFGLAQEVRQGQTGRALCGTAEFAPPEVVAFEPFDKSADMWSIGIITYLLLSGLSPFLGDNDAETYVNVTRGFWDFNYDEFATVSNEAKDFISKLMVRDKNKRMTARQALKHRWLRHKGRAAEQQVEIDKTRLKRYVIRKRWKKAFHTVVALRRLGCGVDRFWQFDPLNSAKYPPIPVEEPVKKLAKMETIERESETTTKISQTDANGNIEQSETSCKIEKFSSKKEETRKEFLKSGSKLETISEVTVKEEIKTESVVQPGGKVENKETINKSSKQETLQILNAGINNNFAAEKIAMSRNLIDDGKESSVRNVKANLQEKKCSENWSPLIKEKVKDLNSLIFENRKQLAKSNDDEKTGSKLKENESRKWKNVNETKEKLENKWNQQQQQQQLEQKNAVLPVKTVTNSSSSSSITTTKNEETKTTTTKGNQVMHTEKAKVREVSEKVTKKTNDNRSQVEEESIKHSYKNIKVNVELLPLLPTRIAKDLTDLVDNSKTVTAAHAAKVGDDKELKISKRSESKVEEKKTTSSVKLTLPGKLIENFEMIKVNNDDKLKQWSSKRNTGKLDSNLLFSTSFATNQPIVATKSEQTSKKLVTKLKESEDKQPQTKTTTITTNKLLLSKAGSMPNIAKSDIELSQAKVDTEKPAANRKAVGLTALERWKLKTGMEVLQKLDGNHESKIRTTTNNYEAVETKSEKLNNKIQLKIDALPNNQKSIENKSVNLNIGSRDGKLKLQNASKNKLEISENNKENKVTKLEVASSSEQAEKPMNVKVKKKTTAVEEKEKIGIESESSAKKSKIHSRKPEVDNSNIKDDLRNSDIQNVKLKSNDSKLDIIVEGDSKLKTKEKEECVVESSPKVKRKESLKRKTVTTTEGTNSISLESMSTSAVDVLKEKKSELANKDDKDSANSTSSSLLQATMTAGKPPKLKRMTSKKNSDELLLLAQQQSKDDKHLKKSKLAVIKENLTLTTLKSESLSTVAEELSKKGGGKAVSDKLPPKPPSSCSSKSNKETTTKKKKVMILNCDELIDDFDVNDSKFENKRFRKFPAADEKQLTFPANKINRLQNISKTNENLLHMFCQQMEFLPNQRADGTVGFGLMRSASSRAIDQRIERLSTKVRSKDDIYSKSNNNQSQNKQPVITKIEKSLALTKRVSELTKKFS